MCRMEPGQQLLKIRCQALMVVRILEIQLAKKHGARHMAGALRCPALAPVLDQRADVPNHLFGIVDGAQHILRLRQRRRVNVQRNRR